MNWKIVIKQLMLFVITVLAVVTGSAVSVNAKAHKPATAMPSGQVKANRATSYRLQAADNNSGTVGSVTYSVVNGTLTLNSGEISADTPHQEAYKYPWAGRDDITAVKITGPIKLDSAAASQFFWSMPSLERIDGLPYLDTTTATDMGGMFAGDQALTSLDLSGIKTPEATNMTSMFSGDASLTSLNVSTLNTSKVTEMSGMFAGDSGLSALNVANFVTDNVLSMAIMFSRDSALKSLDVSNFKTSKVQNMTHMFADDSALTNLNVNNFNTSNVIYMSEMFRSDSSLASLNVVSFDTKKCLYDGADVCV
jgi:surface protein